MVKFGGWRLWLYRRVVRLGDSKISIARGMALGVIFGCLMPPGLQLVTVVPLALVLGGNPIAAAAGTLVSNPVTYIPLYLFTCRVGSLLVGSFGPPVDIKEQLLAGLQALSAFDFLSPVQSARHALDMFAPFVTYWISGGLVVGLAACVPTYYITYLVALEVQKIREFSRARREGRKERLAARLSNQPPRPGRDPDEEAPDEQPPPPPG